MITLMMAGWRLRLICQPDVLSAYTAARYAPFVSDDAPADFCARLTLDTTEAAQLKASGASEEQHWRLDKEEWRLEMAEFGGYISRQDRSAAFAFRTPGALNNLDLVLKSIFAIMAELNGGLLLHASGLLVDGQAFLFMGHGGSGKTTVTKLSPHARTLNDDTVLVHRVDGRWMASGTPFWNHMTTERDGQTASGPLKGVYRLVQDHAVWLEPLSPTVAAAELLANCPVVNGHPNLLPGVLTRCRSLATAVPIQRLHFRKDSSFWALLFKENH